jgi:3-oxoadipate enol-lactonase
MRPIAVGLVLVLAACGPAAHRTRDTANVNGTTLYYEAEGKGPTVVLIPGAELDRRQWDDQFDQFARSFHVIRYDPRGFGKSGRITAPFAHGDDLVALLQQLGVTKATLVGLSLGGRIAIDVAVTHPELVEALVLTAPGLSGYHFADTAAWLKVAHAATDRRDSVGAAEAWLTSDYMRPAMARRELAPRVRALAIANASVWVQPDSLERPLQPPAIGRLSEIKVPTLIVVGTNDDPDIGAIEDTLRSKIAGTSTVTIPKVGHIPNIEKPKTYNMAVLNFLFGIHPEAAPHR